jgi:hypothetical protein
MLGGVILLAASFLTSPVEQIVLRSGAVMNVTEVVRLERGRVIVAGADGALFSIRLSDIDVEATDARLQADGKPDGTRDAPRQPATDEREDLPRKLPVSEDEKRRILAEMEKRSHTGRASPQPTYAEEEPDLKVAVRGKSDEEEWRRRSRAHRDAVERAQRELDLAIRQERQLNDVVLFLAGRSGDASNYGYLVHQLQDVRSMIPRLRISLEQAERAWQRFQDDARRQGVLPGWLRD